MSAATLTDRGAASRRHVLRLPPPRMLAWMAALLSVFFIPVLAPAQAPESLRKHVGPVRHFSLTDSDGHPFEPEQLRGKVWVAHFFFTTCTAGCQQTTATMKELQEKFRDHPHLALVSISVNPDNDSAERLQAYARDLGAVPGQWLFLRGPEAKVHAIVQTVFFQTAERDTKTPKPGQEITHSFTLMLIDSQGEIAGYVEGKDPIHWPPLEERLQELLRERIAVEEPARIWFPRLNASLNAACAVLLLAGFLAIKQRKEALHVILMVSALAVSAVFLGCYLFYHFAILNGRPTVFRGEGPVRGVYLAILLSHTLLAVAVAPLALYVAVLGWKDQRARHARLARWTFPLWLYVSVTGVVVYWMLYHLYPPY
ncbi:MAG: DUF420 domain-containing protein [Gemmataceae bacterium]